MYISGQKRGIKTQRLKRSLKRRQAIEPVIGHLKSDGLLNRNHLKGTQGDQLNVLLSCAGHNLRLILRQLRFFLSRKKDTYTGLAPLVDARSASVRCRHTVEPKAGWSGSATDAHNGSLNRVFQDRLANDYSTLCQEIFNISMTEIEAKVKPDCIADDIGWKPVTFVYIHTGIIHFRELICQYPPLAVHLVVQKLVIRDYTVAVISGHIVGKIVGI